MKEDSKIILIGDGMEKVSPTLARKLMVQNQSAGNCGAICVITHMEDDEGFFHRIQDGPVFKSKVKKKPFYWGLKSKKELRRQGIKG